MARRVDGGVHGVGGEPAQPERMARVVQAEGVARARRVARAVEAERVERVVEARGVGRRRRGARAPPARRVVEVAAVRAARAAAVGLVVEGDARPRLGGGLLGGGERQQVARRRRAAAREAQAPRQRADLVTRPGPRRHDVGRRRDGLLRAGRAQARRRRGRRGRAGRPGRAALVPEGLEPLPDLAPHAPRHEPGQLLQVVERGQRLDAPPLVLDDALPRGLDVPLREARLAQQGPPRGRLEPPRRAVALRVAQARLLRPRGQRRAEPHGDAAAHGRRVAEPVVEVVDVQVAPGHAPAAGHASRVSSRRPRFSRREPKPAHVPARGSLATRRTTVPRSLTLAGSLTWQHDTGPPPAVPPAWPRPSSQEVSPGGAQAGIPKGHPCRRLESSPKSGARVFVGDP